MKAAYIKYILGLLLFGLNGIVASQIELSSYEIVLFRTAIGSLLLIGIFLIKRNKFTFTKHKKDLLFIGISGVAMGASWMFLYEAYSQIGVGIASLLYYCGPVIVMIFSPLLFKERLTPVKIAGFVFVVAGVFLINSNAFGGGSFWGIGCALLAAVTYSVMVISNKKSVHIKGIENCTLQLIFSFLTVAVFVGARSGFSLQVKTEDWPWILILGILNTGIGCYFYFSSIGKLPVQTVAICGYTEPLSAVIFSAILLNEKMLPLQIVGAFLIIGGAVFAEGFEKLRRRQ